jgi:hypothetical protein
MPAVSFDSKSFILQSGRTSVRFPIVAATFDATLIEPTDWQDSLARLRHAGFNTVVLRAPWLLHEPTPGRFVFTGACDVRRAITLAGEAGLRVIVRIGPCVGGGFVAGGLPGWIDGRAREADPTFLARVTAYWRGLAAQFADLQATRNGGRDARGIARPVIAVGLEDDWRCLDADVGGEYFGALVRFAREVGIEVPLLSANNGWYAHEGVIDAWSNAADPARTADELRQVHADAPPMLLYETSATPSDAARAVAELVASRADFACAVLATRHRGASSARGWAERAGCDLYAMRRALVFASTFGELLAGMSPVASNGDAASARVLRGAGGEEVAIRVGASPAAGRRGKTSRQRGTLRRAADAAVDDAAFNATASGLALPTSGNGCARLDRCSGSLVALLGDLLVIAGAPRARLAVIIDGSAVSLAVPADGAAPKVTKVRGLHVAVVPHGLAAGVGVADEAIEFVDAQGALLARVARDGTVSRMKPVLAPRARTSGRAITLSAPRMIVEHGLVDGTHPRFASVPTPQPLGAYGLQSMHGYYRASVVPPKKKGHDIWCAGRGVARTSRVVRKPSGIVCVSEVRADFSPAQGGHTGARAGIVGPLLEVAPLKGVKGAIVDLPRFDATQLGCFAWGYEARDDAPPRRSVCWTFAARTRPVVVVLPAWWFEQGHAAAGHAMRLNGAIVHGGGASTGCDWMMLDGARLSPMRPKALAKGEKPPKGKAITLEPGANELLLDLDPRTDLDARDLRRLIADARFLDVCGELGAAPTAVTPRHPNWAFARVEPPASWAAAQPVSRVSAARKTLAAPAWFRTAFVLEAPCVLELTCTHAAGSVATVLVNGESVLVLDGESGERCGTPRKPILRRTAVVPAGLLRSGENELCVFEPDGVMPECALVARRAAP